MVLSQKTIKQYIEDGKIKIEPFDLSNLKEASYTFLLQDGLTLNPGEFVIGVTKEKITLAEDVCCFLSTRGSVAQQGIDSLQSSNFVEPMSDNHLKLEIKNNSEYPITLEAGTKIVKGIFVRVE